MSDGFYRAFEEKFRGSRESIKQRLEVYLPFIAPFTELYEDVKAIDLGCGRGEWLELVKERGFDAQGVDLDDGMLAACRDLGLQVQTRDAVSILKELPDDSQVLVSGFHIAEHMPFAELLQLVQEALRVLKPAGLLILETPNPENIMVGTSGFYLDPTHHRPIPYQLLSFLPDYYGFARVKVLRLQEAKDIPNDKVISLLDVLRSVSPDYAIVAQKGATLEQMQAFDEIFRKDYGLALETVAQQYEARIAKAEQAEFALEKIRSTRLWRMLKWINNKLALFR